MTRADGRTSLIMGEQDIRDLLASIDHKIGSVYEMHKAESKLKLDTAKELIRYYKLYNRVQQARERLESQRLGRGTGGAS